MSKTSAFISEDISPIQIHKWSEFSRNEPTMLRFILEIFPVKLSITDILELLQQVIIHF